MQSEVARLRAQIDAEYEAALRGLHGLCYGTPQHEFITARMENVGQGIEALKKVAPPEVVNEVMTQLGGQQQ